METCAKCGLPMVCGHTLMLNDPHKTLKWRVCCLCTGELIHALSGSKADVDA